MPYSTQVYHPVRRWGIRYIYPFTIKPDYEAPDWDTQGMETGIPTDINHWLIDDPDFLELNS
jgi:hypothetical protein